MKGFIGNIEKLSLENNDFRRVLYTAKGTQLVLMRLAPGEEIGNEVHDVDQFFRFEQGQGKVVLNGADTSAVSDGDVVIIPAGTWHNIVNVSATEDLRLYTLYSPPHHRDKTVHTTKEEAETDNEEFDGVTSE